jgi:hypothetical protein
MAMVYVLIMLTIYDYVWLLELVMAIIAIYGCGFNIAISYGYLWL